MGSRPAAASGCWRCSTRCVAAATVELFLARLLGVAPGRRRGDPGRRGAADLAALVRQLPDARSLCRAAGAGGGAARVRVAGAGASRAGRGRWRSTCCRSPSTARTCCWPLAPGTAGGAAAGRRRSPASSAALRLGLPTAAAVALLLRVGWLGFGQPSLTPQGAAVPARPRLGGWARAGLSRAACPQAGWAICPHVDRLAGSAQEFLWRPQDSYWGMDLADARRRARRGAGDPVAGAGWPIPWASCAAALANGAAQLGRFGLDDFVLGRGAAVTPDDYTFVYLPLAPAARLGAGRVQRRDLRDRGRALAGLAGLAGPPAAAGRRSRARLRPLRAGGAARQRRHLRRPVGRPPTAIRRGSIWLLPLLAAALLLRPAAAVQGSSSRACRQQLLDLGELASHAPASRRRAVGDSARPPGGGRRRPHQRGGAGVAAGSSPSDRLRRARSSFCAPLIV